ncbi:hypothetical protein RN001_009380 [Aquatica leii]|uniref:FLYWCH-type domain-containing protein n=1 Tax=Aquatica leii TaxID=1421715 RepID=A0AAN7PTQ2_9COLE|nr:hypothetical protein RN001_009380 [Aquatica leii]
MVLQFVKSTKGNNMLLHDRFIHKKESISGEKIFWKCVNFNKSKCPGRVHTLDEEVVKSTSHNHVADAANTEARKTINQMKTAAEDLQITTRGVLAIAAEGTSCAAAGRLPSVLSMKRTVQRIRKQKEGAPTTSKSLMELVIPDEYLQDSRGKPSFLFDSGPGEDRILLYSTERNLSYMEHSRH